MSAVGSLQDTGDTGELTRVMALHALLYCERLFYLEEVEEIRVADHRVLAGREEHALMGDVDDGTQVRNFTVTSPMLGLRGSIDAFCRRDGRWVPYEHKRGSCARDADGNPAAWPSDRVQVAAYALLLEEETDEPVREGRIRYHASNTTVKVPIDEDTRSEVRRAIARANEPRTALQRPPVTENPRLCARCSLAPVCLPEEARLVGDPLRQVERLFPPVPEGALIHVTEPRAQVGRAGDSLVVTATEGSRRRFPIREVSAVVVHGHAQVTTQALHLCGSHEVPVHWPRPGGAMSAA